MDHQSDSINILDKTLGFLLIMLALFLSTTRGGINTIVALADLACKHAFREIWCKVRRIIKRQLNNEFNKRTNNIIIPLDESAIFLIGTPEHGNLGDHAIAKAEMMFLRHFYPKETIIEITGDHFRNDTQNIKKLIRNKDKILITGGGFLGSLWIGEEELARDIIRSFPSNKIVIFPQTIYFEDSPEGTRIFHESLAVYQNHSNLTICAREQKSYDLLIKMGVKSVLLPDMVTYLKECKPSDSRRGVLLCLRSDKEKILSDPQTQLLKEYVLKVTDNIYYSDTVIRERVIPEKRDVELEHKLSEFRARKIVITDRLHGMIFAAITGTPCIAMNNISGKVMGVYQWLRYLPYIRCINSVSEIEPVLAELMNMENCGYENDNMYYYYLKLAKLIA